MHISSFLINSIRVLIVHSNSSVNWWVRCDRLIEFITSIHIPAYSLFIKKRKITPNMERTFSHPSLWTKTGTRSDAHVLLLVTVKPPDRFLSGQLLLGCASDISLWQIDMENLLRFYWRITAIMCQRNWKWNSHAYVVTTYSCLSTLLSCVNMCYVWSNNNISIPCFYMY